jgi:hypothetical protein
MSFSPERAGIAALAPALELRRRTKKTMSATRARNRSEPTTAPAISGVLPVGAGVEATMLVVEDARPGGVSVEANCALVVEVVAPITVADVDVVVVAVVAAVIVAVVVPIAVVDVDVVAVVGAAAVVAFVVPVVGGLVAVQLAIGRLEQ